MKRLLIILAYFWAIICMLIIPVAFAGNNYFAKKLSHLSFMKINPIYTGGDSIRSYVQDSLEVTINKPVFESLIGSSTKGFVQVRYTGIKQLPETICSTVDYDNDNNPDFRLNINTLTGNTQLEALTRQVLALDVSAKVKDYWIVRVKVLNPDKK